VLYKDLLLSIGSVRYLVLGYKNFSKDFIILDITINDSSKPFLVTILKLSALVWYSLKSPNFDLQKTDTGKSIPGKQYCLSSEPLCK
tara:strand:- start:658 stop:918 length:261 start_codon:yes stop_codon:yes gene_type:complete